MSTESLAPGSYQDDDVALIAVMGPTGSGKSTFINTATRAEGDSVLQTSASVKSCTNQVQVSDPVVFQGKTIKFIDTPGFDDTERTDTDILRMIAVFLIELYGKDKKLAGIIYTKDISRIRMTGAECRNLRLFRELTGDKTLRHVVIVTTMWKRVSEVEGITRLTELVDERNTYFAPMLKKGAVAMRHEDTLTSAERVLEHILRSENVETIQICFEMVVQKKELIETGAGRELGEHINQATQSKERRKGDLQKEIANAKEGDEEARLEREAEMAALIMDIQRLRKEKEKLQEKRKVWMGPVKDIVLAPLKLVASVFGLVGALATKSCSLAKAAVSGRRSTLS